MDTSDNPNKTYIKSNASTVMHFLWFLCGLLLVLVAGLCSFVIFGRDDIDNYHYDANGKFYYAIADNKATIVKYLDRDAESYVVPASVNYGNQDYPVTAIGDKAFSNHTELTSVEIPDSVTEIMGNLEKSTGAFSGCLALQNVKLGNGIARIGVYAFKNCMALTAIDFPSSVQFIDEGAFSGCIALQTIALNSNSLLGKDCFADCISVKTLSLSDDVRLTDSNKRQALAGLSHLTNFKLTENNSVYRVDDGGCLVNWEKDTVVLGGYGASVPATATEILDWAWGERAQGVLFVPSSVVKIGANSFAEGASICTPTAKPFEWLTVVPVYTEAKQVVYDANLTGVEPVNVYIYKNGNVWVKPSHLDDVFPDVQPVTAFIEWSDEINNTYTAQYQDATLATASELDDLTDELDIASSNLNNGAVRLQFKLDFWEQYKNLYYQSQRLNDQSYLYEVLAATQKLKTVNQQIAAASDSKILESTDWKVGLQNLVDAIDNLSLDDLSNAVTEELLEKIDEKYATAKTILTNPIDNETAYDVWYNLRDLYEKLTVNCGADSNLQNEITTCKNLSRDDYTKKSWQVLQEKLKLAEQVTEHNLNITAVRQDLIAARKNLCEVTLPDTLTELSVFMSACRDLPENDYEKQDYDILQLKVTTTNNQIQALNNNSKVNREIAGLKNLYQKLELTNNTQEYQNSTGILDKKSLPFFMLAVVLFTGAVTAGAKATSIGKQLRQTQE